MFHLRVTAGGGAELLSHQSQSATCPADRKERAASAGTAAAVATPLLRPERRRGFNPTHFQSRKKRQGASSEGETGGFFEEN